MVHRGIVDAVSARPPFQMRIDATRISRHVIGRIQRMIADPAVASDARSGAIARRDMAAAGAYDLLNLGDKRTWLASKNIASVVDTAMMPRIMPMHSVMMTVVMLVLPT